MNQVDLRAVILRRYNIINELLTSKPDAPSVTTSLKNSLNSSLLHTYRGRIPSNQGIFTASTCIPRTVQTSYNI